MAKTKFWLAVVEMKLSRCHFFFFKCSPVLTYKHTLHTFYSECQSALLNCLSLQAML